MQWLRIHILQAMRDSANNNGHNPRPTNTLVLGSGLCPVLLAKFFEPELYLSCSLYLKLQSHDRQLTLMTGHQNPQVPSLRAFPTLGLCLSSTGCSCYFTACQLANCTLQHNDGPMQTAAAKPLLSKLNSMIPQLNESPSGRMIEYEG